MDSLTERTLQSLRERLQGFRTKGAIPALMAEFRTGAPAGERQPLDGFEDGLWAGALRQLPDGSQLSRNLWLAGDRHAATDFRDNLCLDVGRVVLPILYAAGYRVGLGSDKPQTRWLWATFELAELRLPGTYLRLDRDTVWRVGAGGVLVNEGMLADPGPFAGLAETAGDTRYWKLADAVEASLAVLDIAQTQTQMQTRSEPGPEARTAGADVDEGKGRPKRKMRPEEHLLLLYFRDPKVATLESRSLPAVAEAAFGERFTDRAYRDTVLYGEWRAALEKTVCRHGDGWLEGDVLEAGLEIYAAKPGRSDKRRTFDRKYEAALRDFLRDAGNAAARAKARGEDGGK